MPPPHPSADPGEERLLARPLVLPMLWAPALALAATLAVTGLLWRLQVQRVERELRDEFALRAQDVESRLAQRMLAYEQVLRGAAALFAASGQVDRGEFRDYVASLALERSYPGVQGVGFAERVPGPERARHVAAVRAEGFPHYDIHPPGDRPAYAAVVYLEPLAGRNLRAFGFDTSSEEERRRAQERALAQEEPALTGKVQLLQETDVDVQPGFIMFLPVFKHGAPHRTLAERRASILGWVYLPFRARNLLSAVINAPGGDLDVAVYDGDLEAPAALLYRSGASERPRLASTRRLEVAGRRWTVALRSGPELEARFVSAKPRLVVLAGLLASVLSTAIAYLLVSGRARAIAAARRMNWALIEAEHQLRETAEELRIGEERLALAISGSSDGWWDLDVPTGRVAGRWPDALGFPRAPAETDLDGWRALHHPEDTERASAALRAMLDDQAPALDVEYRLRTTDGAWRWVRSRGRVVQRDAAGRPRRAAGVTTDVDAQHRSRERLLQEARLQALPRSINDIELVVSTDGRIVDANDRAVETYGYPREELLALDVHALRVPQTRDAVAAQLESTVREGRALFEAEHVRRDGTVFPVEVSARVIQAGGDRYLHSIVRDLTDRRRAEAALRASEAELRALAATVEAAREEEKARIAGDLHDELGQLLTALKMELRWLERRLGDEPVPGLPGEVLDHAVEATALADRAIASVQAVARELRPGVLDRIGLESALAQEARQFEARTGVPCSLAVAPGLPALSGAMATALYRIAMEALTNVARHAGAGRVAIALQLVDGAIALRVEDDGCGLPPDVGARRGTGLVGMRERAARLGGEVAIDRRPAGGTVVSARLPLDHAGPASATAFDQSLFVALDRLPQGALLIRADGAAEYWNRWLLEFTGLSALAAGGTAPLELVHPEDRERIGRAWTGAPADGSIGPTELRLRGRDGAYRWFASSTAAIRDSRGAVGRWLVTLSDIEALEARAASAGARAPAPPAPRR